MSEGKEVKTKVDPRTGEIISVHGGSGRSLAVPDPKTVSRIDKVAGKNPPAINLRDHPEFSGLELYVMDAKFGSGDIGGKSTKFVVIAGYIVPPGQKPEADKAMVIITGADNVYSRIAQAFVNDAFPIVGTLRHSGRAWFLD